MWNKPSDSERIDAVTAWLDAADIAYDLYFHPASPTIELAKRHWRDDGSKHCKNLFFRNHKGNRHYLVCFDCDRTLSIHDLEARLHQGKLSFASPERMMRYLGLEPGSVSPFGLINDAEHHVHLFLDRNLLYCPSLSFHPNDCRATVVIARTEFERYLARVDRIVGTVRVSRIFIIAILRYYIIFILIVWQRELSFTMGHPNT